jgi:hypothetical protein
MSHTSSLHPAARRCAIAARPLAAVLIGLAIFPTVVRADEAATIEKRLLETATFLASPELGGRAAGSPGLERAAQYVAEQFRHIGLKMDVCEGEPFQTFTLPGAPEVDPQTQLRWVAPPGPNGQKPETVALRLGQDFTVLGTAGIAQLDASLVFAGYGITAPSLKYDDYAGIDVTGKVVVVLRGAPQQDNPQSVFDGTKESVYAGLHKKIAAAVEHGAAGVIFCTGECDIRKTIEPLRQQWQQALGELAAAQEKLRQSARPSLAELQTQRTRIQELLQKAAALGETLAGQCDPTVARVPGGQRASVPVVHCRRAPLDRIVKAAAGTDLATLERQIDAGPKPQSRELTGWRITGRIEIKSTSVEVKNVVAVLPGTGPHAEETIVVGAHYDHVGTRRSASGALEVFPGADDNASGVSALLEVARQLSARVPQPGRRVVFIAFTAEERGLLGSQHYVDHPLLPLDKTVAMVNLDMVGRLREDRLTVYGTGTSAGFAELVDRVNQKHGLELNKRASGLGPSDHASFSRRQVPVLFFITGMHSDLHRPTDTVEKLNVAGLRRVTGLVGDVVTALAAAGQPPQFVAVPEDQPNRPFLGVSVSDEPASGGGYAIRAVLPNMPAYKAGLREGDVILRCGDRELKEADDLPHTVAKQKIGDKVRLQVRRGTEQLDVDVTLGGTR